MLSWATPLVKRSKPSEEHSPIMSTTYPGAVYFGTHDHAVLAAFDLSSNVQPQTIEETTGPNGQPVFVIMVLDADFVLRPLTNTDGLPSLTLLEDADYPPREDPFRYVTWQELADWLVAGNVPLRHVPEPVLLPRYTTSEVFRDTCWCPGDVIESRGGLTAGNACPVCGKVWTKEER